jgi:hypothetical protein
MKLHWDRDGIGQHPPLHQRPLLLVSKLGIVEGCVNDKNFEIAGDQPRAMNLVTSTVLGGTGHVQAFLRLWFF